MKDFRDAATGSACDEMFNRCHPGVISRVHFYCA